jgi:hypothetical protein
MKPNDFSPAAAPAGMPVLSGFVDEPAPESGRLNFEGLAYAGYHWNRDDPRDVPARITRGLA